MKFSCYAVQFESLPCRFEANYSKLLTFLNFCEKGSLVVFPEVAATAFCYEEIERAVKFSERVFEELQNFSKGLELTVVITGYEQINGKLFNSVKVLDRGREVLSRPKVKLFKPGREHLFFTEGRLSEVQVAQTSLGVLAPVICFELRFYEVLSRLKELGGEVFTVPAQWGRARREHWSCLLRARAIELQRFFVGANGTGKEMGGCSAVIDPWGRILAECKDAEGLIRAEVDTTVIEQVERKLPLN
ncbi:nitrilase-related carbon-nitrogen hydrolase [Thermovibrio ammonificans]